MTTQSDRRIRRRECPEHGVTIMTSCSSNPDVPVTYRCCECDAVPVMVEYVPARGPELSSLEAIASAAWRVRQMLHLNLARIAAAEDPVLTKNVVDAINDLNEHLPLSEDGWDWGTP